MPIESLDPTVARFFRAMQAGAPAASEMMSLFHDDAIYQEPFSGVARSHQGKPSILQVMQEGWSYPLPEMTISIDRVETDAGIVRAWWTCRSPGLPGGSGRGLNTFSLRDGKITRLVTEILSS